MKVCVIGLGEIGYETFKALKKDKDTSLYGVEINKERRLDIVKETLLARIPVSDKIPKGYDIYIISVYTPKQILDVISNIDAINPLIVIESTMLPGETKSILERYPNLDLVLFPHRYNPNDKEHHVFNLDRIIGASSGDALARAVSFYRKFIPLEKLHLVPLEIAELSKPLENAYRYIEIAIAEEVKLYCDAMGIDFDTLRHAMNTKWNIDLKEARDGIGLKCLPKDCKFVDSFFKGNYLFKAAMNVDESYRKNLENNGIKPADYREVNIDKEK